MKSDDTEMLLSQIRSGDAQAIEPLLDLHRNRLKKMIGARLNPQLRNRVDESDILQDTLLEASQRIDEYFAKPPMPFFLWLRWLAGQNLKQCHRHHLDVQKRDARRVFSVFANQDNSLSEIFADQLVHSTPSGAAIRKELIDIVDEVMHQLKPKDREILCMRHIEQLTNQEVAQELEIDPSNASTRYLRALAKLQDRLAAIPGFFADEMGTLP